MNISKTLLEEIAQKKEGLDQRDFPRWDCSNRVLFQLENNLQVQETWTTDLSCQGICVRVTGHAMAPGQEIKLTLFLSSAIIIGFSGKVIWLKASHGSNHAGILFSNASAKTQDKILEHAFGIHK